MRIGVLGTGPVGQAIATRLTELGHEVKAITYHGLRVERDATGWLAEVIVDI